MRSVNEAEVGGKRVLVRVDFNVPLRDGAVADDTRIKVALPTLKLLREKGARAIILLTHVGRPGGTVVERLRVAPVRARLSELVDMNGIELQENLRFDPREEKNDESFAKELAALGDVFVNEAFADSHRAHASIVGIPKLLPAFAGLRFVEEVEQLQSALTPPPRSVALIGGAKFETKEPLLRKLLSTYQTIFVGGALGNDLLKSRGWPVGSSLTAQSMVPTALAEDARLVEPIDLTVEGEGKARPANTADVRAKETIVDIGPHTAKAWAQAISQAPFVLWNGPMGLYEKGFTQGSDAVAQALAQSQARAVVGGGDTVAAVQKYSFDPSRVFLSSAGGAMLQFLSEGTLPGIEALSTQHHLS